jgi:hypothetical protein
MSTTTISHSEMQFSQQHQSFLLENEHDQDLHIPIANINATSTTTITAITSTDNDDDELLPLHATTHELSGVLPDLDAFETTLDSFTHYTSYPLSPSQSPTSLFFGDSSSSSCSVFSSEEDNNNTNMYTNVFPIEQQSYTYPSNSVMESVQMDQIEANNQAFSELIKDFDVATNMSMVIPTFHLDDTERSSTPSPSEASSISSSPSICSQHTQASTTTTTTNATGAKSRRRRPTVTKEEQDHSSSDSPVSTISHRGRKRRLTVTRRENDDIATTSDSRSTSGYEANSPSSSVKHEEGPLDENEKKERNRKSAFLYRKKRKVYVQTLENQLSTLNAELHQKDERMKSMEMENTVLKQQLLFFQSYLNPQMLKNKDGTATANSDKLLTSGDNTIVPSKRSRKSQSSSKQEIANNNNSTALSMSTSTSASTVKRGRKPSIFKSPMSTSLVMLAILSCFLFCTPWFGSDFIEAPAPQYTPQYEYEDFTFSSGDSSSAPSYISTEHHKSRNLLQYTDDTVEQMSTTEQNPFSYPLFSPSSSSSVQIEDISNADRKTPLIQIKSDSYPVYDDSISLLLDSPQFYSLNTNSSHDDNCW